MFKSSNSRYCIVTNRLFIVCKGTSSAPTYSHHVSMAESSLEDLLSRRIGSCIGVIETDTPEFAFEVTGPQRAFLMLAESAQDKALWWSSLSAAQWSCTPDSKRTGAAWRYERLFGTLHASIAHKDENSVKRLLLMTDSGRKAAATAPTGSSGALTGEALAALPLAEASTVDIHEVDGEGMNPLLLAVHINSAPLALRLLEHGASVNSTTPQEHSALHIACANCDEQLISCLVANGADSDATDIALRTPLLLLVDLAAALEGCSVDSSTLPKHAGANTSLSSIQGALTALLHAAAGMRRVDLEAADLRGDTALSKLARLPQAAGALVPLLVRAGCDVNAAVGANGVAPLHIACGMLARRGGGSVGAAEFATQCLSGLQAPMEAPAVALLRSGALPNARSRVGGWAPMHLLLHGVAQAAHAAPPRLPPSPTGGGSLGSDAGDGSTPQTPEAMAASQESTQSSAAAAQVVSVAERMAQAGATASLLGRHGARGDVADAAGMTVAELAGAVPHGAQVLAAAAAGQRSHANTAAPDVAASLELSQVPGYLPTDADLQLSVLDRAAGSPSLSRPVQWRGRPPHVYTLPTNRHDEGSSSTWAVHDTLKECQVCSVSFSMFNRRHHCRSCYRLVCSACSAHVFPFRDATSTGNTSTANDGRCCDGCFNRLCVDAVAAAQSVAAARQKERTRAAADAAAAQRAQADSRAELMAGGTAAAATAGGASAGAGGGAASKSSDVKAALERTHAKVAERGERLGRLDQKAEQMSRDAEKFEDSAAALAEKFRKQNSGWGLW